MRQKDGLVRFAMMGLAALLFNIAATGAVVHQAVYVEAGGPGIFLSVNYENRFTEILAWRVGFGFALLGYTVPVMINFLMFPSPHHLEFGIGIAPGEFAVLLPGTTPRPVVLLGAHIGYRYQPPQGGVLLRLGFTPLLHPESLTLLPWGGLSLGWAF